MVIGRLCVALAAALSLLGCGNEGSHEGAQNSCAAPQLALSTPTAAPGDSVDADGKYFASDCYDTGQAGQPPPLTDMRLNLTQGGKTWPLADHVNADGDSAFHVAVVIPDDVPAGAATVAVRVDSDEVVTGQPAPLEITGTH